MKRPMQAGTNRCCIAVDFLPWSKPLTGSGPQPGREFSMTQTFAERLKGDIWSVMRHEAAITAAAANLRPYSVVSWNGWRFVPTTYNFARCKHDCHCWNCRPDLFPPVL